jgi:hypothetical protein
MYSMNTRPDICFAVNTLSQFLVEPRRVHLVAAKHVCNVPDLASLGNAANVCVGSKVYNI